MTQNNMGNSSYSDDESGSFIKSLYQQTKFDLEKPILDVGSGFGAMTYELAKLGAKNIYSNDLSQDNLNCMKKNIDSSFGEKKIKLEYLIGDINSKEVLAKLPDNAFSFIIAKNVIQFFDYNQLLSFIKNLSRKAAIHGVVVIVFENPYYKQLNLMIENIRHEYIQQHKESFNINMDQIVNRQYKNTVFPGFRRCSYESYTIIPHDLRLPGVPCEIPVNNGHANLLLPGVVINLMGAANFYNVLEKEYPNKDGTVLLVFIKEDHMSMKKIDRRTKSWLKKQRHNFIN